MANCSSAGFGKSVGWPIRSKDNARASYWLTYFRIDGEKISDLNRQCKLNDNVLRNLVLKVDARIVDALVAHANTGTTTGAHPGAKPEDMQTDDEKVATAAAAAVAAGASTEVGPAPDPVPADEATGGEEAGE